MGEKIFECEYEPGKEIVFRFRRPSMLLTGEAREHLRAAQREVLLALRDIINEVVEKTEPKEKGPTKIKVE